MKIGGVEIKHPTTFSIERFNLTKSGRVASGKMAMEIVAKKRKYYFTYSVLSTSQLAAIRGIVDGNAPFFLFEYEEDGTPTTATVYAGAIKAEKFREGSVWYWKNVSFDLIEQ